MAGMDFDALINDLHEHSGLTDAELNTETKAIIVNEKRQFTIPSGYNTVLAYEGDVNSQLVTFECPILHEGHSLKDCQKKIIKWKHTVNNLEDSNDLKFIEGAPEGKQYLQWTVPPELFREAGSIEISLSLYDVKNGQIAFAWNTAVTDTLSVAASMDSIGYVIPPKDEILLIDTENRGIIAPKGYNNIIAYQGDVGISKVYFTIKRFVKGIDVLNDNSKVILFYKAAGYAIQQTELTDKMLCNPEIDGRDTEGLVLLTWNVPDRANQLVQIYNGKIEVSLQINSSTQTWHTNTYKNLEILPSFISQNNNNNNQDINEYLQSAKWHFNGNQIATADVLTPLSGVVTLRTLDNPDNSSLNLVQNELLPSFDEDGTFQGIYLHVNGGELVKVGASQEDFMKFITDTEWIIDANLTANE